MKFNFDKRQKDKKRSLEDDSSKEVGVKKMKVEVSPLNPVAFPHIAEKIFDQLDKESLRSCREVSKSWLNSIDKRNCLWKEILKNEGGEKVFLLLCRPSPWCSIIGSTFLFAL